MFFYCTWFKTDYTFLFHMFIFIVYDEGGGGADIGGGKCCPPGGGP